MFLVSTNAESIGQILYGYVINYHCYGSLLSGWFLWTGSHFGSSQSNHNRRSLLHLRDKKVLFFPSFLSQGLFSLYKLHMLLLRYWRFESFSDDFSFYLLNLTLFGWLWYGDAIKFVNQTTFLCSWIVLTG